MKVIKHFHWEIDDNCFKGKVKDSDDQIHDVYIDIEHPRKAYCRCSFTVGRKVICKHMVALYLTVFPEKVEEVKEYQEEEESYYEGEEKECDYYLQIIRDEISYYVNKLSKKK